MPLECEEDRSTRFGVGSFGSMMKKIAGFTLIEMLVVVVVAGIGFSLAVPSFQGMLARNRLATQTNDLLLAVNLARSEASRVGGIVSIQAADPTAGDEFGEGWCVVIGDPGDCTGDAIRRFGPLVGDVTLESVDDPDTGQWDSIQFNGLGALSGTDNNVRDFDLCLDGYLGRRIRVALIGRVKAYRTAEAGDPVPAIQPTCP